MVTLNHTNLTTYNVPELAEFFRSVFGFVQVDERAGKLAVLRNQDGFRLTLMFDKSITPEHGYPAMFHVGFIQSSRADVDRMHALLSARQYPAPKPGSLPQGGVPTYGFYCQAPGGVVVEVSTTAVADAKE
jgi:catechol 2,3-dioxygenase-like lactoylglutathione lyase family enzyme